MALNDATVLLSSGLPHQRDNRSPLYLLTPELLTNIFRQLERRGLAKVARVCRFWSSMALDLLWESISSFRFLLMTGYSVNHYGDTLKFIKPPIDSMWGVVEGYARRVRSISFAAGELEPEIISYIASRLESASDSPYFLPKLRHLHCFAPYNLESFLPLIQMLPPDLPVIRLSGLPSQSPGMAAQIFDTLSAIPFRCLISIIISGVEQDSVEALASLVQLQPTLESLELSWLTAESLSKFSQHTQLTKLDIQHRGTSLEAVAAMFRTIGSLFPGLRTLDVRLDPLLKDEVGVSTVSGISSCHELRHMAVACTLTEILTSQTVSDMGQWWPFMEEFWFGHGSDVAGAPGTPLSRLYDIARAWSITLRSLSVPFNLEGNFPAVPETIAVKFCHLQSIIVISPHLPVPDHRFASIAGFLAAITKPRFTVQDGGSFGDQDRKHVGLLLRIKEMREVQWSAMLQTY